MKRRAKNASSPPVAPRGAIGKYASLAFLVPISTFVGYGMGYGLDYLFHATFLRWIFLALGTVSGFISLVRELDEDK
ncbi:MAG: AtpZ/AtpI family protein [Acidobacteriota bacterium]|nr:AtpZ/AtpI family protein [Acidobacteriota bacterium]